MKENESKILIKKECLAVSLSLKTNQVHRMEEKQIEKGHKL
jgi:hypothetical protein